MANILITGVSSGIGAALASIYLAQGYSVYGFSRRTPHSLLRHPNFHFQILDLSSQNDIAGILREQFAAVQPDGFEIAYLNAGISGNVPEFATNFPVEDLMHVMSVNVWANKIILDQLLAMKTSPRSCVVSASMAGVRFRAGTLPYSMSKAALHAMCGVYAAEHPEVLFAVLGLCNVNTCLSRQMAFSDRTTKFSELAQLQKRALADGYMVSARQRAEDLFRLAADFKKYGIVSGNFVDIRTINLQPEGDQVLA